MKNQEIEENNNYRQGRSKKQYETSETLATWAFGALVVIVAMLTIYNLIIHYYG